MEFFRDFTLVLVTSKCAENPIKSGGAFVSTTFFRAQGRVTLKLIDGQNSNSSEVLWLPLLPVSLMMIQSKMKMLSCLQHFLYCKSMGNVFDAQEQVTPMRIGRSGTISNLSEILCPSLLPARLKKIRLK